MFTPKKNLVNRTKLWTWKLFPRKWKSSLQSAATLPKIVAGVFDRKQTGTQVTGGLPFTITAEFWIGTSLTFWIQYYTLQHNFNNHQSECMLDGLSVTFELNTHEEISRRHVKIDDVWIFTMIWYLAMTRQENRK